MALTLGSLERGGGGFLSADQWLARSVAAGVSIVGNTVANNEPF